MNNTNQFSYKKGLHFYINLKNFDSLVKKDEMDGDMSHMIHFLNTYLVTLERYIRDNFDSSIIRIEKLTGSRIHLIIYRECDEAFLYFLNITNFAIKMSDEILSLPKYKTLSSVSFQVGADYGDFADYYFEDESKEYEEYTSIGYPANFACKLQILANAGEIIISKRVFDGISDEKRPFITSIDFQRQSEIYSKYPGINNRCYVVTPINRKSYFGRMNETFKFDLLGKNKDAFEKYADFARTIANKKAFSDMEYIEPRKASFNSWNLSRSAKLEAAIVFADVRDFTKKFSENGSNLSEMSLITTKILNTMYSKCELSDGVHVQFQGDREFVFFTKDNIDNAVIFALQLRAEISRITNNIEVGIGVHFGTIYASQIGIDSEEYEFEKQNIVLGETIKIANKLEDECALKGEIVLSDTFYNNANFATKLKRLFNRRNDYWVTKETFNSYMNKVNNETLSNSREVYKPWRMN